MGAPTPLHRSLVTSQSLLAQRRGLFKPSHVAPRPRGLESRSVLATKPPCTEPAPRGWSRWLGPPPAPPRLGHGRSGLQGGCWAQVAGPRLAGGWAEVEWEASEGQRGTLRRQGARTPALTPSLLKHPLIMLALVPQDPCLWAPHGGAGPRSERQEAEAGCGDVPRTHRAPGSGPDRSARRGAGQEWARLRTGP